MISAPTACKTEIAIDRKQLQLALKQAIRVIPHRSTKPILQCVLLRADEGLLQVSATDMDVSYSKTINCTGLMGPCVVDAHELGRRANASKHVQCMLRHDPENSALVINGGRVEHRIHTLPPEEYPPILHCQNGPSIRVSAKVLQHAVTTCNRIAAREPTRYAINGVFLESEGSTSRLVATDGRRMVVVELEGAAGNFVGQVILPLKFTKLVARFIDAKKDNEIRIHVDESSSSDDGNDQPAKIFAGGSGWTLATRAAEGSFPAYRDVIPPAASTFVVHRTELVNLVNEVAIGAASLNQSVVLRFSPSALQISASSTGIESSSGSLEATFCGGGDEAIVVGVNPEYLIDALKSFDGDEVGFDVRQNTLCRQSNTVRSSPICVRGRGCESICHVIMPVNLQ